MISFEIRQLVLRRVACNVSLRYHNVWGELELGFEAGSQRKCFFFQCGITFCMKSAVWLGLWYLNSMDLISTKSTESHSSLMFTL